MVFIPDKNFHSKLEAEVPYQRMLETAAQSVIDKAKAVAPPEEITGDYHEGLKVVKIDKKVYASGTDWKSNFIEFGTGGDTPTPAFAPLRRGARAAGLKLEAS